MQLFISFLAGTVLFFSYQYFPFSSLLIFTAVAFYLLKNKKFIPAVLILLGFFYALVRAPAPDLSDIWNKDLRITGKFSADAGSSISKKNTEIFVIDSAVDDEKGLEIESLSEQEVRLKTDFEIDPEETYELLIHTGIDRTRLNPGGMSKKSLFGKIIEAREIEDQRLVLNFFDRHRLLLNAYISKNFGADPAAFISAITTGGVMPMSEDLKNAFNSTGLAHILSISGTHFGLFSVVVFGFIIFLIKQLPYSAFQRLTLYVSPSQLAALLSIPFMVMYLGISGGSIPAVRSFIMISLFLFGLIINRKGFWLNTVLFAAFMLVLWEPDVVLNLSFQLSFLSILFIGFSIAENREEEKPEDKKSRILNFAKSSVRLTLAASLGTGPLVAYIFHYFSIVSPLSNLIAAPLIGFVLMPLALFSAFAFLLTGSYILAPFVKWSADISIWFVKVMASIPFADIKLRSFPIALIILFYASFFPYLFFGRKRRLLFIPLIPIIVYSVISLSLKKELSITFLDVGQGDSAVVELPDSKTLVIDTGMTGYETAQFLRYIGKRRIDALIQTHSHPDHSGGMQYLADRLDPEEIWDNGRPDQIENINSRHRILERGDTLEKKLYSITVLHPYKEFYTLYDEEYREDNDNSLVLRIKGSYHSFLFTGDIEDEAEEDIAHAEKWLKSDVIKIPHHGSRTSANHNFLAAVSPAIAVISVGYGNSFGHPHQEILQKLEGVQIFRTDLDGAIKITETAHGLKIKTFKDFMLEKADNIEKEKANLKRLFVVW